MRKVFNSSSDVIHLFAQREQEESRCSNVFFDNKDKIYSYGHHYLLGEFIDDNTIMIDDRGYSVTTSKHISQLNYATRQYKQFYKSQTDIDAVYQSVLSNKKALINARKPEKYITPILSLFERLNEYLEYTKNKTVKKSDKYKEIKSIVKVVSNFDADFQKKMQDAEKKRIAALKRKEAKEVKEKLQKFNSYEVDSIYIGGEDFLRLSKDGTKVETSQRVSVSKENAKALYEMIKRGIDIKGKHIENYVVTSINGTLKIGCHNINIDSVHAIGKLL